MSKELTEQWRNGTLPKGWYYVETPCEEIKKLYCGDGETLELEDPETSAYYFYYKKHDKSKIDILGVVPDYMDCKGLMYDSIALDKARKRIEELEQQNAYECECNKEYAQTLEENAEMKQKIHILTESQMNLENAIGSQADFFRQKISVLESQLSAISEQLKEANEIIKKYRRFEVGLKVEKGTLTGVYPAVDYLKKYGVEK